MDRTARCRAVPAGLSITLAGATARADDAGAPSLTSSDLTFTLARVDSDGHDTPLSTSDLNTFFSVARCACPTNVTASLSIGSTGAATLGAGAVDVQLMVGNDCDNISATDCVSVGSVLTLSAVKLSTGVSVGTAAIFDAAKRSTCNVTSTSSTRLWAIVRVNGQRLTTEPSLALTLGGAGPK